MLSGPIVLAVIIATLVVGIASVWLLYRSNGQFSFVSPSYLFGAVFLIMVFTGSLFVLPDGSELVAIVSVLGLAGFSLGVAGANRQFDHRPVTELAAYLNKSWSWHWCSSESGRTALAAGGAVTLVMTISYFVVHGITISSTARIAAISASTYYVYAIMAVLPFFVTLAVLWGRITGTIRSNAVALCFIMFSILASGLAGYRAPIGHILILALLTDQFHTKRLNMRWLGVAVVAFLGLFVVISANRYVAGDTVVRAFVAIWDRIVMVNPRNIGFIVSFFPANHEFLLGSSYLMDITAVAPGPDETFGGWMMAEKNPALANTPAGMTQTLVGESYANFGLMGALVVPAIFGFVLQTSWIAVLRRPKYIDVLSLAIVVWLFAAKAALRGVAPIVASRLVIFIVIFAGLELTHRLQPIERTRELSISR